MDAKKNESAVKILMETGVVVPNPGSIEIGEDVVLERIAQKGVVIHTGSKIYGKDTYISENVKIGTEGPVTLSNCLIGAGAELKSGFFEKSVFLKEAKLGYGSHVRAGTILEEYVSVAHTVGLKQTILFPYVTLGSLINFCDCFMAGGTGPKNHSEVGSSYIHFNFTPNQDKATPSLIGCVPRGVMLSENPIFLGGQGGMVGPCFINYGNTIAAGVINRKDETRENRLIFGGATKPGNIAYEPSKFINTAHIYRCNIKYIANLFALHQWYCRVRPLFISDAFPEPVLEGLQKTLKLSIDERINRLDAFMEKMDLDPEGNTFQNWTTFQNERDLFFDYSGKEYAMKTFLNVINEIKENGCNDYIDAVKKLDTTTKNIGANWLTGIVEYIEEKCGLPYKGA